MKKYFLFPCFLILLLLSSCTEKPEDGGISTATVVGFVQLVDDQNHYVQDASGVNVTLYSPDSIRTELSDENGRVIFDNVPSGTYNIKYSKEGYGEFIDYGERIIGGPAESNIGTQRLYAVSNERITDLTITDYYNYLSFNGDISSYPDNNLSFRFYFSTDPDVSCQNYTETVLIEISSYIMVDENHFSFELWDYRDILSDTFGSGITIYAVAYGCHIYNPFFFDIINQITIYSSLSHESSNIAAFSLLNTP